MHSENLNDAFARCLELLDEPAAADPRADFAARFTSELERLEQGGATIRATEADGLLSALGAAQVGQWDLALAFLDAARRSPAGARRPAPSPGTLRQRFHFVMATGAEPAHAR